MRRKSSGKPEGVEKLFACITTPEQVPGSMTEEMIRLANNSHADCIQLVALIQNGLRKFKPNWTYVSILILEECVFNCSLGFHAYVATTTVPRQLYDLLKGKRGRGKFQKLLFSKEECQELDLVEDKAVFLLQKWADTFMFHEDRFPIYMELYKKLRSEGVQFPEREPENFIIKIKGFKSPLQDMASLGIDDDQNGQAGESPSSAISPKELKLLESSLKRLQTITNAAEDISDFTNQFSVDLINTCKTLRRKLSRYISLSEKRGPKPGADRVSIDDMLIVVEYANKIIDEYDSRYKELQSRNETTDGNLEAPRRYNSDLLDTSNENKNNSNGTTKPNPAIDRSKSNGSSTTRNLGGKVKRLEPPPTSRGTARGSQFLSKTKQGSQSNDSSTNGGSATHRAESTNLLDL
mmetsp:Transcript_5547/g.6110  ORF Transcript_5547/g.6110 Transcript_5547/m.6110 type:complete len:408 (-) Transcript_5547:399-1622(-)